MGTGIGGPGTGREMCRMSNDGNVQRYYSRQQECVPSDVSIVLGTFLSICCGPRCSSLLPCGPSPRHSWAACMLSSSHWTDDRPEARRVPPPGPGLGGCWFAHSWLRNPTLGSRAGHGTSLPFLRASRKGTPIHVCTWPCCLQSAPDSTSQSAIPEGAGAGPNGHCNMAATGS